MDVCKEAVLTNVHLEPWTISNGWTRGPATGRITVPAQHRLTLETAGWSASTKGMAHGPVLGITAEKQEELQKYKGKLKGAIVLAGRIRETVSPGNPLSTPWAEDTIPVARPKSDEQKPFDFEAYRKMRQMQTKFFAEEGVAAVLLSSDKSYGLLDISVSGREYVACAVPTAYTTREDFALLWRLVDPGAVEAGVRMES